MSIIRNQMKKGPKSPKIIQKDDPVNGETLMLIAKKVKTEEIIKPKIKNMISEMFEILKTQNDGVALAAPQTNISLRIFIVNPKIYKMVNESEIRFEGTNVLETVFINPEIIKISKDKKKMEEGCLSVRPWYGKVRRASRIAIRALNENGKKFTVESSGLIAQIFQHEIDHLNGVLFIDKATNLRELPLDK